VNGNSVHESGPKEWQAKIAELVEIGSYITGRTALLAGSSLSVEELRMPTETTKSTRTEKDSLGHKEVPAHAYYGIQTARAVDNFPISGLRAHSTLIRAIAMVKEALRLPIASSVWSTSGRQRDHRSRQGSSAGKWTSTSWSTSSRRRGRQLPYEQQRGHR